MKFTATIHKGLLLASISSSLAFGLSEYSGSNPVTGLVKVSDGFLNTNESNPIIFDKHPGNNRMNFNEWTIFIKHLYGEKAEGAANDSDGIIVGKSSNGKIESDISGNLTIIDQSLINMQLSFMNRKTMTLTNVTLEDFQFSSFFYDSSITLNTNNLTLNLRVTDLNQPTAIINTNSDSDTYTLNLTGSLVLDVYMTDAEAQSFAGGAQAITLTGITSLDNIDGNVAINFKNEAGDILFTGMDVEPVSLDSTGNMTVNFTAEYIPEPSTATLSLLALAGLLIRRRRKIGVKKLVSGSIIWL